MNVFRLLAIITLIYTSPMVIAKSTGDTQTKHTEFPAWFIDNTFLDLEEALENARATGKKGLLVVFSTEGCSYCSVFNQKSLANPEIAGLIKRHYDAVGMEIFDDNILVSPKGQSIPIKEFAKNEGVQFSPTVMFYDLEGNQVFHKSGYQSPERFKKILAYVSSKQHKQEKFSNYMNRQQETSGVKTVLLNNTHFEKPSFSMDRRKKPVTKSMAEKPLIVLFEKNNCQECNDFHKKVLQHDEVDELLNRFDIVRLNADDNETSITTPLGKKITPAQWYAQEEFTRLPSLMFIDPDGNTSLKTDSLVLSNRMLNSMNYMLEKAYKKGWTYQRFARKQAIERNMAKQASK